MKKKMIFVCFCALLLVLLLPQTVSADMGPKPSVHITFEGLGEEVCYATLLSKVDSTGPYSAWDGTEANARYRENADYSYAELDYETWKAFAEYEDGFYFLQEGWRVDETGTLDWTYYPPSTFKILLYFSERGVFAESGVYERYAFDSYFTVDLTGQDIAAVAAEPIVAERSYDYTWETLSLLARIVVTIALEIGLALLFGYRAKKQLFLIAGVNLVTQIILNLLLNIVNYSAGFMAFVFLYALLELIVFTIEAAVYRGLLDRWAVKPRGKAVAVVYALLANILSYGAGFVLALVIPGMV